MTSQTALAIGPANFAGQAHEWARAVREHTPYAAWSFAPSDPGVFAYGADRRIGSASRYTAWGRRPLADAAVAGATHVALDGFDRLYGWPKIGSTAHDLAVLGRRGLRLALVAHGSEVRDPEHHEARNPHSYFRAADAAYRRRLIALGRRNRGLAARAGVPVFVSTPDLLWDLPDATWLPVTIDPRLWTAQAPALTGERVRVLHLPSRRTPPTKGTHLVSPVLHRLAADGLIDYLEPEHVAHDRMPELVGSVDVVIDQITGDAYGVAGAEAMAAGRLVLAGVHGTRAKMTEAPPIVDVSPETLADVVRDIAAHPERYRDAAAAGPGFVERWHDGAAAARALTPYLETH